MSTRDLSGWISRTTLETADVRQWSGIVAVCCEKNRLKVPDRADYDPDYFEALLSEEEAARFLGFTVRALQNWRTRGGRDPESRGPKYVGRTRAVRYRRRDLIAWSDENLVEHSSQPRGAGHEG